MISFYKRSNEQARINGDEIRRQNNDKHAKNIKQKSIAKSSQFIFADRYIWRSFEWGRERGKSKKKITEKVE